MGIKQLYNYNLRNLRFRTDVCRSVAIFQGPLIWPYIWKTI